MDEIIFRHTDTQQKPATLSDLLGDLIEGYIELASKAFILGQRNPFAHSMLVPCEDDFFEIADDLRESSSFEQLFEEVARHSNTLREMLSEHLAHHRVLEQDAQAALEAHEQESVIRARTHPLSGAIAAELRGGTEAHDVDVERSTAGQSLKQEE